MPVPNLNDPLDIQRPALEILMEQINVENTTELLVSDFLFSVPSPATLVFSDINTKVTLTPKVTSGYFGSRDIYYKRMSIANILNNEDVEIIVTTETLLSEIIPQIITKFGINLTTDDYIDTTLPVVNPLNPDAVLSVIISIKPESYLFMGTGNLVLGERTVITDDFGVSRDYFITTDVGANAVYTNNLFVLDSTFTMSQSFNLFKNATDITKCRIDDFTILSNNDICLRGEFGFDVAIGAAPLQTYDVKTVFISSTGNIKSVNVDVLFGDITFKNLITNRNVDKVYVVDKTDIIGTKTNRVYRYNNDGTLDSAFTLTALSYVPDCLRIDDDGKIYTASAQRLANSPVSPTVAEEHIRIDRFLPTGAIDVGFTPVTIGTTGAVAITPVVDIKPFKQLGAWILLKPLHGVSTANASPLINLLPFVPGSTANDGSFNPLFRINYDGSYYTPFKPLLLNNTDDSIFVDSVDVKVDTKAINGSNTKVSYLANRRNPLNGYLQKSLVSYNPNGSQVMLTNSSIVDEVKWDSIKEVVPLLNGNSVVYGSAKVKLPSGGWSNSLDRVMLYNKDSQLIRTLFVAVSASAVSVFKVDVNEIEN